MTPEELEKVDLGVYTRRYERIAEVFNGLALQANREGLLALLLYLYRHHIPLAAIVDDVVRPAFHSIGEQWERAEIEVGKEHAASHAVTESLIRMSLELHRKALNGLSALCACPEDELHELGLRGLAYSLECEGWKIYYIGANTPAETLTSFVRAAHPELVCLSMTMGRHRGSRVDTLRRLSSRIHSYHGRIIVGGAFTTKSGGHDIPCDHVARSIQDAIAYTRDAFGLKPGPKRKTGKQSRPQT
jgi:methanogenic corrinoid protein MtbC1